jgi:hypothetical protein
MFCTKQTRKVVTVTTIVVSVTTLFAGIFETLYFCGSKKIIEN